MALSAGSGSKDLEKAKQVLDLVPAIEFICLDVANGYTESFVQVLQ